jgi:hypothetical protein
MQPNNIEINEKNTTFLYETNIQTKCHKEKYKVMIYKLLQKFQSDSKFIF